MSSDRIASVFIATSIDGYIARKNGNLDWLDEANSIVPEGEDCGFFTFMNSVDVLVMGRITFEKVLSFGQWVYGTKEVVVLSKNPVEIPSDLSRTVTSTSEPPKNLCKRLVSEGKNRIYVDGGITIQSFLVAGLIKDITITRIPILIGNGVPLFGELSKDIRLKHIDTKIYEFGFIQSKYEIENPA